MASSKLTTKEGWLSTRMLAARLTISLSRFLADNFFRSEKKVPAGQEVNNNRQNAWFIKSFTIVSSL
jgi:hypothetical protein